jgi:oxygen-independent coproporphyrinogen-3 oxidase
MTTATHPVLSDSPYHSYVYAYPHKTAYRPFATPKPLREVWSDEGRMGLSLYAHVPFCGLRCGFCNLFTTAKPHDSLPALYLDALDRQCAAVCAAGPDATFSRLAVGGGTPTYLSEPQLEVLFATLRKHFGVTPLSLPTGVEVSPDTVTPGKAALLKAQGVGRVSIGVQSFDEREAADSGRPQLRAALDAAFAALRDAKFPTLNIDLIYGLPGQTVASWIRSLDEALTHDPGELYLYPLYVRPLTGLGRSRKSWDDTRLACYREARAVLLDAGFEQVSMRYFRRRSGDDNSAYCVQNEGMVGVGCGARSYTRRLHYSLDYAVAPKSVKAILADYITMSAADFAHAHHGFTLDGNEERRRTLLYALFTDGGLDSARYRARFAADPAVDFPDLTTFADLGLMQCDGNRWTLTPAGLERSDALGPWCFSTAVREMMAGYEMR